MAIAVSWYPTAEGDAALTLQRPLPDGALMLSHAAIELAILPAQPFPEPRGALPRPPPCRLHRSKTLSRRDWLTKRQAGGVQQESESREPYRRWPRPTPRIPALRRRAPTVRFITFETLVTGVRAFECAFSVRTSSFVHGLMTRRAVFAFTVLADFAPLTVFFKALGIIQVLHLNAAQIGIRCGDKKAGSLTYSILSDNWYVIVLPPVEEEIRCRKEEIARGRV